MEFLFDHIKENAKHATKVASFNTHKGQAVTICGAGPSLAEYQNTFANHVWACNSALTYMKGRGWRVTHGFCIDQGPEMLNEKEWQTTFPVEYLVSSSVNPALVEHLVAHKRKIRFFHNFLGTTNPEGYKEVVPGQCYEMELYRTLYPTSVQVGHGLNAVPRAVCLAIAMGFDKITVYGADSAAAPDYLPMPVMETPEYLEWTKGLVLYADGRTAFQCYGQNQPFAEAPDLKGRRWHTRPDMVVSAMHLLDLEKAFPGRIEIMGDTLPNALRGITENLPQLTQGGEVTGFGNAALDPSLEEIAA